MKGERGLMEMIDLSHVLGEQTPLYPGDPALTLTRHAALPKDGYNAYTLSSGLHTGTHIDMPMHFSEDQRTAADFPAERFIGRGVLLDVRGQSVIAMDARYERAVAEGSIVLLYTGFDRHYFTEAYFTQYSTVSDELASFLVSRSIKMLGMDMPAPDYPPFALHQKLLANDIFLLENLTNLQSLLHTASFDIIALPLKISAEASPVRAVAVIR